MKIVGHIHTIEICKTCGKPKKYTGKGSELVTLCSCWKKEKKK